jgi:hypothetical protein
LISGQVNALIVGHDSEAREGAPSNLAPRFCAGFVKARGSIGAHAFARAGIVARS